MLMKVHVLMGRSQLFNSRVIFACGFSIIVWEQFISFREEYDVVWRTGVSWSLAKVVFVMNRYCAIAGLVIYIVGRLQVYERCTGPDLFCLLDLVHKTSLGNMYTCPLPPNRSLLDLYDRWRRHSGATGLRPLV